jgi:uncharacterized membrane protein YraQ (UPF0718 family)
MDVMLQIPAKAWEAVCEMAPYLLFGFLVAGILSVFISPERVERYFGGRGLWPVVKASLLGVPLPLCSCGVIPVAASLRRHGAGRAATVSFLLSTPQTGVDSIMVTLSLLGPVFAVFRPLAAFATGVFGGWLADAFDREGDARPGGAGDCAEDCCVPVPGRGRIVSALRHGFVVLPRDIARPMLAGLLVAGAISAAVPDDFFAGTLGSGILAMLGMMALSMPLYVCATASVPIAAALILKGVSPGVALVFLVAGPGTNAAAIATIWKMMGARTTAIYLGTVAAASLASGLLLDGIFRVAGVSAAHFHGFALPHWAAQGMGVALLLVLGAGLFRPGARKAGGPGDACCHEHGECCAREGEGR